MSAKEKQATRSGICFSKGNRRFPIAINEQTSDEIGQKARQREFASKQEPKQASAKQADGY